MGMSAMLTLAAMYSYRTDLFEDLQLPTPPTVPADIGLDTGQLREAWTISTSDFVDFLCLETMGMSLAFPDADFLKEAIGIWSKAHIHEWQRMFDTLFYKYNPLWNKDGKITESGTDNKNTESTTEGSGTGINYVHSYTDGATTLDGLTWDHANRGDSNSSAEGSQEESGSYQHTRVEQGNIGVTMTQELIERERELAKYSFEEYLVGEFKRQFCILVY